MSYSSVRDVLVAQARALTAKAEKEGRGLTVAEKQECEDYLEKVKAIDDADAWVGGSLVDAPESVKERARAQADDAAIAEQIARYAGGGSAGLASAMLQAGFSLKQHPSVTISSASAIGAKAGVTDSIEPINWSPRAPDLIPMGRDQRFLWQQLPTTNVQGTSSIQDFKQTARGITGSVERAIDATSDKAEVTLTLDLVIEELVQWAVVISDIPNAMLEDIALLRQFLDAEMRYRIGLATDAHAVGQIIDAAPSATATGDLFIETVRYAVADMRAAGASPSLLVLDPTDAVALDLEVQPGTSGDYVFPIRATGSASPLWGLSVVESPAMAGHNGLLVDPQMLGTLFLGNTRLDADPFTGFRKNLTTLRAEVAGLFHVRNAQGARILDALS